MGLKRKQIIFPPFLLRVIFAYLPIVGKKINVAIPIEKIKKDNLYWFKLYCNRKAKILGFHDVEIHKVSVHN